LALRRFDDAQGSYDRGLTMLGLAPQATIREKGLALLRLDQPIGAVAYFDAALPPSSTRRSGPQREAGRARARTSHAASGAGVQA
jgi:hypothetical protein